MRGAACAGATAMVRFSILAQASQSVSTGRRRLRACRCIAAQRVLSILGLQRSRLRAGRHKAASGDGTPAQPGWPIKDRIRRRTRHCPGRTMQPAPQ